VPTDSAKPGAVVVVRGVPDGFRQEVQAGRHHFVVDEPVAVGGTDAGPTPYDLLLASLGTCTAITLRMYAARKGWPLTDVEVRLRHEKIHARDCAECETKDARVDHIDREIVLKGDLDDSQRERLLQIANRCPVHQTLGSEIHVTTRLT
jgi:putative redox protein